MHTKKNSVSLSKNPNLRYDGYKFHDDAIINQMAYAFADEKGEAEALRIFEEAERQYPNPLQLPEKRKFIEEQVRNYSKKLDSNFQEGFFNITEVIKENAGHPDKQHIADKAGYDLLRSLGINVNPENVTTRYQKGPPEIYMISFVLCPTKNLANKNSNINKLSESYRNTLTLPEQEAFKKQWEMHTINAEQGGPKQDRESFMAETDKDFANYCNKVNLSQPGNFVDQQNQNNPSEGMKLG